jgi:hypothetical protein
MAHFQLPKAACKMKSMKNRHKRVTVSLPGELVAKLDRSSRRLGLTRSGLAAQWLSRGSREQDSADLDRHIETYYAELEPTELAEDESISRAAARLARRLTVDKPPPRRSFRSGRSSRK